MFYSITGRNRKGQDITQEVVLDMALATVVVRMLTRNDIDHVVVREATAADFRKYQRTSKK